MITCEYLLWNILNRLFYKDGKVKSWRRVQETAAKYSNPNRKPLDKYIYYSNV